jgi:phage gp46-like protein
MPSVLVCQKPNSNQGSPVITDKGIQRDPTIASGVFLSLGLDKRVGDVGGWFQETYSDIPQGSKLHTLQGRKIDTELISLAKQYAEEALQWFIDDGIASEVDVAVSETEYGKLSLEPVLTLISGTKWSGYFEAL